MVLPARSLLFVPANRPDRYAKAAAAGADKVIIDLEDSVPADQRAAAREMIAPALPPVARERLLVRVNPISDPDHPADLAAVPLAAVGGLMVPKLEHTAELRARRARCGRTDGGGRSAATAWPRSGRWTTAASRHGHSATRKATRVDALGSSAGRFLVVLIETARGVRDAEGCVHPLMEAAASLGRACVAAFGALDYGVEVRRHRAGLATPRHGRSTRVGRTGMRRRPERIFGSERPRRRTGTAVPACAVDAKWQRRGRRPGGADRIRDDRAPTCRRPRPGPRAEALAARRLGYSSRLNRSRPNWSVQAVRAPARR